MSLHSHDDPDAYGPQTDEEREQDATRHDDHHPAELDLIDKGIPTVLGTAVLLHALGGTGSV